ncbi:MAG TPA: TIR domain-containing protein, partial [Saprospiraceae bacterium]|nr:TIR domain-containing protein [Saprospiraceae bacterium]
SKEINLIRAFHREDLFAFLYTEITHDILRFKLNKEKLHVFISHVKKDGREIAKLFKDFIDSNIKLDNFFDETDIQSSESWKKALEDNVGDSLFLFIYSDNYAHTIWTQQEFIWAKQKRIPIVGVDVLGKENKRVFSYIGNIKMVKLLHEVKNIEHLCDNNFSFQSKYNMREIINALLKEALENYLFIYKTDKFKDDYQILSRPPELLDLCDIQKNILYPDPPLMYIEKKLLDNCIKEHKLLTPLMLKKSNIKSKKIAISISEPHNLTNLGYTIEHLNMLMIELARYLLIQNNTLLYGGDLGYKKEFNFTQLLAEIQASFNYAQSSKYRVINYAVKPFSKNINLALKNRYKTEIDFQELGTSCSFDDVDIITRNLSLMRERVTNEMDMKISVGGKIIGFAGFYPGILEEVYLAIKANKPTYLISAFGGITKKIINLIRGEEVEELTFEYQMINTEKLRIFVSKNPKYSDEIEKKYKEMYSELKENKSNCIFICDSGRIDDIISFVMGE